MSKGKVVVFGSIGINRGDDLMGRIISNYLVSREIDVFAASMSPSKMLPQKNVIYFSSSKGKIFSWLSKINNARAVIIGGGTLIQNDFGVFGVSGITAYISMVVLMAKVLGVPVYGVGLGVRRLNGVNKLFLPFLKMVNGYLVRDVSSKDILMNYGVDGRKIEVGYDIGLNSKFYDDPDFSINEQLHIKSEKPILCISLVKENIGLHVKNFAINFIDKLTDYGFEILLLAMDEREEEELGLFHEIKKQIKNPSDVHIVVPNNPAQVSAAIKKSNAVVAFRLHCAVMAVSMGKPTFVLAREAKQNWLSEFVGQNRWWKFSEKSKPNEEEVFSRIVEDVCCKNFTGQENKNTHLLIKAENQFTSYMEKIIINY